MDYFVLKVMRYKQLFTLFHLLTAIVATTSVVTSGPTQYPQQQTATPGHPYQQYSPYQPIPVQPGYPAQPMPQGYGAQNMPTSTYQGQPFMPGPPPTYLEASECRFSRETTFALILLRGGKKNLRIKFGHLIKLYHNWCFGTFKAIFIASCVVFFLCLAGPEYPVAPYSQAAFNPGHPTSSMQPPVQPQPSYPPAQTNFLAQPAYNPDFVAPPPKTG